MACPSCGHPVPEGARFCPSCGSALVPAAPEERRVVTVLFADVVGFTTLAEHRDPEQVKRLLDVAFERLALDIEQYGGRVDKVLGDALVALFGAPVAHEDDAERAVRAALQMHDTLTCLVEGQPDEGGVRLRIGINTGEVLVGSVAGTDYTAMGDVVNTASRLQALAPTGGVLVGDATRALCSDAVKFEALEPQQLRGRDQVEHLWLVTGLDAPARRRRRVVTSFVGRTVERSILRSVVELVRGGRSALVSVVGEAGIGKSRLVDEVVGDLRTEDAALTVLEGACVPYGDDNVWSPIASGIAADLGLDPSLSAEEMREALRRRRPADAADDPAVGQEHEVLLHLFGHSSDLDRLDPAGVRDLLFTMVIGVVRSRAERGPVVLWIDDMQWSHALVRDLLGVLVRSLSELPVLIVTACRPSDDAEWPPSVDRAVVLQLPLGPLGPAESAALVGEVTGRRASPELVSRLYDRSGGNPLFLTELAALAGTDDGDAEELPGTLRALIAARLDELRPAERAIVDNAAILGTKGHVRALEEFAHAMHQEFEQHALTELVSAGLLELHGATWEFRSDVVREVAYQTLTKQSRAQRHAGVATVMAASPKSSIDDLAHHAATAAELLDELGSIPGVVPAIRQQAIELLTNAARRSYDLGGFRHGAELAERALGLVRDDPSTRRRLLVLHATGLVELRATAAARADLDEAIDGAVETADLATAGEAFRLLGTVEQLTGDLSAARDHLGRSVEIFRGLGDDIGLAQALRARGFAELFGGSLQEAEWFLGEADAVYVALGDERGRAWIDQHRAWVSFLSGDNPRAEEQLRRSITVFESVGDQSGLTWARGLLAFVMYFQRRFAEAEAVADDVLDHARRWGDDWGAAMMLTLGASLRLWSGRFADAAQYAERALAGFRRIGDRFGVVQALAPLNRARVALGRTADAERGMEELLSLSDAFGEMAFPTIAASGVAMHLGRGERTVELASQAVDRMSSTGANVDEGRVQLAIGQIQSGDPDDALATLLDVDVEVSPFALAARALAHAVTGDVDRALADADAAVAIDGLSYFDRSIAMIAAAAAADLGGRDDASARLDEALAVTAASGDVVIGAVARALAQRIQGQDGDVDGSLTLGWRRVVDQLVGAPA